MPTLVDRSFRLNFQVLNFFGLYPPKARGYVLLFALFGLVILLTLVPILVQGSVDILQMNFSILFLVDASSLWLKFLTFLRNGDRIRRCVGFFADPQFLPRDAEEARIVDECIRICRRNSVVLFDIEVVAVVVWVVPLLFTHQLPFDLWLPLDPNKSSVVYYSVFLYLVATCIYCGFNETVINPLIAGLAYHAASQLKILKYNLQKCSQEEVLKRCVDHHNSIFRFLAYYEQCFSFPIFCQFAGSMFALCFSSIGLILAPSAASVDFAKAIVCLFVSSFQILFYCFYGTLLFEENDKFSDAIYMGPWYTCDVNFRKILIIIMERSKRPMIITAGKIVDVTLQTFASVLKTSYSLIAVFNNYQ